MAVGLELILAAETGRFIFDSQGQRWRRSKLARPSCLAAAPPITRRPTGVCRQAITSVFSGEGKPLATWPPLGEKAILTSIALAEADAFVADAGQARVHRLSLEGEARGAIGGQRGGKGWAPFAVPSPFFDVAMHPDGWLRVVNPGALRVEAYSYDGKLQLFWARGARGLTGSSAQIGQHAVLSDSRL